MSTTHKFFNTKNEPIKWRIDDDGFLRCTTSVLKSRVMDYGNFEFDKETLPDYLKDKATISLFVPEEEVDRAESITSLEGKPVTLSHDWQVGGSTSGVGNVAGAPRYDSVTKLVISDILVTDPATIKRITQAKEEGRLIEQSAGYNSDIDWTPGIAPDGTPYDGVQRNIRYNHVALLPVGRGRAGSDVRIINEDRSNKVSEFTTMKIGNSKIRVMNEDADYLQDEMDKKDEKIENMVDVSKLEESMKKIEDLNGQLSSLSAEREKLVGEIEGLKAKLEELTNPENMQAAVDTALEEKADANEILNACDGTAEKESRITNMKKLFGHELRKYVVNQVRVINSKPELTEDEAKNQARVSGMFQALKDTSSMIGAKKAVAGSKIFNSMVNEKSSAVSTAETRKQQRYEMYNEHFGIKK